MDDLTAKINELLSDPKSLEQIKGLGEMLSLNTSNDSLHNTAPYAQNNNSNIPPDMLNMMGRLMPMLSSINSDDDTTRLLVALRPFLSAERQQKLDTAQKLIKMMKLLPILKDANILDSFF